MRTISELIWKIKTGARVRPSRRFFIFEIATLVRVAAMPQENCSPFISPS
jgi:hypothetical protein